ncbi:MULTISPECIES: hypothetical protein, partial [Cobetia]|uniref:hypothetical protein n=1 Tax=Cobetia TaxID=204286 RepID=UPI001C2E7E29
MHVLREINYAKRKKIRGLSKKQRAKSHGAKSNSGKMKLLRVKSGICQHSWHMKWFWLFKALLPAVPDPAPDSDALSPAGR